jgi:hypothetical protein
LKRRVTDLDWKRNFMEAITFYIIYLIIGVLVSSGIGAIAGNITNNNMQAGIRSGVIFAGIYTAFLYYRVYTKKKMKSTLFIAFGVLATIIGFFYGMIASIIFVAVLTTRESDIQTVNKELDI